MKKLLVLSLLCTAIGTVRTIPVSVSVDDGQVPPVKVSYYDHDIVKEIQVAPGKSQLIQMDNDDNSKTVVNIHNVGRRNTIEEVIVYPDVTPLKVRVITGN